MDYKIFLQHSLHEMVFPNVSEEISAIIAGVAFVIFIFCISGMVVAYASDDDQSVLIGFLIAIAVDIISSLLFFFNIFIVLGIVAFFTGWAVLESNWWRIKKIVERQREVRNVYRKEGTSLYKK